MHPKMMIALANEVQRDRESELQGVRLRSVAVADRPQGLDRWLTASGFARRLLDGITVRPRLS